MKSRFSTVKLRSRELPLLGWLGWLPGFFAVATFASHTHAQEDKPGPQPVQLLRANAKTISPILAQGCSETSWQAFSIAAQGAGYLQFAFKDAYDVWPSRAGLKLEAEGVAEKAEVTITAKGKAPLALVANGHTYTGADSCELIAAYLKDAPTMDDKGALAVTAAMLAGTSQLALARAPADLSAITTAMVMSLDAGRRGAAKLDLGRVLDANYTVRCTDTIATIQTAVHKIVVHRSRGAQASVDVFDKETDIAINQDRKSVFATHARAYLASMTDSCKKPKDAEKLQHVAVDTLDEAQTRATSLEPVGPERQPANEK